MNLDLRGHGVLIRRERLLLDHDGLSSRTGTIEAGEHQMQVHRQRVHRDHFERLRARQLRQRIRQLFVIRQPRTRRREVTFDRKLGPMRQLFIEHSRDAARLQAKRVTAQINAVAAALALRNEKLGTQWRQ